MDTGGAGLVQPEPRFTIVELPEPYLAPELPWADAPYHLVGSGGDLLMVVQSYPLYDGTYQRQNAVSLLHGQVLLLGLSHFAVSLPASELGVEDSCIYIVTPQMPFISTT